MNVHRLAIVATRQIDPFAQFSNDQIIEEAMRRLDQSLKQPGSTISIPKAAITLFQLLLAPLKHEVFAVLFLDSKNRLLAQETLFSGTQLRCPVYARRIAERAFVHNAVSVVFGHNHPGGDVEPSSADLDLTREQVKVLAELEIKVLDHIIIAGTSHYSMAEHGQI